jgi:hypothetical protein
MACFGLAADGVGRWIIGLWVDATRWHWWRGWDVCLRWRPFKQRRTTIITKCLTRNDRTATLWAALGSDCGGRCTEGRLRYFRGRRGRAACHVDQGCAALVAESRHIRIRCTTFSTKWHGSPLLSVQQLGGEHLLCEIDHTRSISLLFYHSTIVHGDALVPTGLRPAAPCPSLAPRSGGLTNR